MIVDCMDHLPKYMGLNPNLDLAIQKLSQLPTGEIPFGRVEIDKDKAYYSCDMQRTRKESEALYEAHQNYIDIHICLEGQERIKVAPIERLAFVGAYDDQKDVRLAKGECAWDITLKAGEFMICFAEDAHMPLLDHGQEVELKKVIVKAAV